MALNSYNKLATNNTQIAKNIEKLSSGFKINRAADDAAGLAISEKMRAQITGLNRAAQNVNDGISLVQTAEGALTEIHSMLNRMVDLATQSSNGTIDNEVDRKNLQKEVESLKGEINRIANTTCYNNINVLKGYNTGEVLPIVFEAVPMGINFEPSGDVTITGGTEGKYITLCNVSPDNDPATVTANWVGDRLDINFKGQNGVITTLTQADMQNAINNATGTVPPGNENMSVKIGGNGTFKVYNWIKRSEVGAAKMFRQREQISGKLGADTAQKEFNTRILVFADAQTFPKDTSLLILNAKGKGNFAEWIEYPNGDKQLAIYLERSVSGATYSEDFVNDLIQNVIGNKPPGAENVVVKLMDGPIKLGAHADDSSYGYTMFYSYKTIDTNAGIINFQIGDTAKQRLRYEVKGVTCGNLKITDVDISTEDGAIAAIDNIKNAINYVSETRANLGAIQNRLEHTANNLASTSENITYAESRIRDTDMAKEMMAFTKNNILSQAAQAMLSQANQQPNNVISLLR